MQTVTGKSIGSQPGSQGRNAISRASTRSAHQAQAPAALPPGCLRITVHDSMRGVEHNFDVHVSILHSSMSYFRRCLPPASTPLDSVEVAVHCDVTVFDWLLSYIYRKSDLDDAVARSYREKELHPLTTGTVIPIFISAEFLGIPPLLDECAAFIAQPDNLRKIVSLPIDLSCISDAGIERIAASVHDATSIRAELMHDSRERLIPKIFRALTRALVAAADLARCAECGQIFPARALSAGKVGSLFCHKARTSVDFHGSIVSRHTPDPHFNALEHFAEFAEGRTGPRAAKRRQPARLMQGGRGWEAALWRVMSHAIVLRCETCGLLFPLRQLHLCRFHPQRPAFESGGGNLGKYPCCGVEAVRFSAAGAPGDSQVALNGCKFRSHKPAPDFIISPFTHAAEGAADAHAARVSFGDGPFTSADAIAFANEFGSLVAAAPPPAASEGAPKPPLHGKPPKTVQIRSPPKIDVPSRPREPSGGSLTATDPTTPSDIAGGSGYDITYSETDSGSLSHPRELEDDLDFDGDDRCPIAPFVSPRVYSYTLKKPSLPRSSRAFIMADIVHQSDVARLRMLKQQLLRERERSPKDAALMKKYRDFPLSVTFMARPFLPERPPKDRKD